MIMSIKAQTLLFLSTVLIGFFIAFIYDIFRVFRKYIKHSSVFVYLEDALYWVIVSFAMFYFMLSKNYGEIRAYAVIGTAVGAVLYLAALSPMILKISTAIIDFSIKVISAMCRIIWAPISVLLKLVSFLLKPIVKVSKNQTANCKRLLQKSVSYAKMKGQKLKCNFKIILKKT